MRFPSRNDYFFFVSARMYVEMDNDSTMGANVLRMGWIVV